MVPWKGTRRRKMGGGSLLSPPPLSQTQFSPCLESPKLRARPLSKKKKPCPLGDVLAWTSGGNQGTQPSSSCPATKPQLVFLTRTLALAPECVPEVGRDTGNKSQWKGAMGAKKSEGLGVAWLTSSAPRHGGPACACPVPAHCVDGPPQACNRRPYSRRDGGPVASTRRRLPVGVSGVTSRG